MRFNGDDIATAFGQKPPSTRCAGCGHRRQDHRREILRPGGGEGSEAFHECERFDGRTKSGYCPCEKFGEPVLAGLAEGEQDAKH